MRVKAASVVFGGEFDQADDVVVEFAEVFGGNPVLGDVPATNLVDRVAVEEGQADRNRVT